MQSGCCRVATRSGSVSREQFIRAYVLCNNRAWTGVSYELIPFVRQTQAIPNAGTRSPAVLGFIALGYLLDGQTLRRPRDAATLGWATAVKAYADDGGIEPRFRTPATARAYLRRDISRDADALDEREVEAIATNLHLARLAGRVGESVQDDVRQNVLTAPLDASTAARLLRVIGSHESIGGARIAPLSVRPCGEQDALRFLRQSP